MFKCEGKKLELGTLLWKCRGRDGSGKALGKKELAKLDNRVVV